jgi:hypothetical protein
LYCKKKKYGLLLNYTLTFKKLQTGGKMPKRRLIKKKVVERQTITLCKAEQIWPRHGKRNSVYFCAIDNLTGDTCMTNGKEVEPTTIIRELLVRYPNLELRDLKFKPPYSPEVAYADGYFGRKLIPASVTDLSMFYYKKIKKIKGHFRYWKRQQLKQQRTGQ